MFFSLFLLSSNVFADSDCVKNNQVPSLWDPNCTGKTPSIGDIIAGIVPIIPTLVGALLFGVLIWGGIQIFSANANEEAKKKGIKTIQNAITGIVLLFLSIAIITIIESILGQKILFGVFVNK